MRIPAEEYKEKSEKMLNILTGFYAKNPEKRLSVNAANTMFYDLYGTRINAPKVKELMTLARKQVVKPSAPVAARERAVSGNKGETIKVRLRDGREVYVVVLE